MFARRVDVVNVLLAAALLASTQAITAQPTRGAAATPPMVDEVPAELELFVGETRVLPSPKVARIAVGKAGERARGAIGARDAFFPFRDGLDELAAAGVTALVEPGGSVRDDEVIAAADEHGIALVFTGERHFRH